MKIRPARRIKGTVRVPGDKSISHRASLIAALAKGKSHITNFSTSRDCDSTLSCLEKLGVSIERNGNNVTVDGVGLDHFSKPGQPLDCGNSGSTLRMLAGILAGQSFASVLTGDSSLRSRPMKRIIEPLEMMGARVLSENQRPPLHIEGHTRLQSIKYQLPVASAQVKSCVLFAGLQAEGRTEVIERNGRTRDHTERMLQWFGAPIEIAKANEDSGATASAVVGPASFQGHAVRIPGDFSSASFLITGAALLPASELEIEALGLNPTRTKFLETLQSLGAQYEIVKVHEDCNEPVGTIHIRGMELREARQSASPITISGQLTAELIDELPLLAVIGTQVSGSLVIRDAAELRVKETDRIAATVRNLRAMGTEVEEYEDGLAVAGPVYLQGARLNAYGDHRIAMAFTIAALLAEGDSEIRGSECVAVSYPEFFERLESVVER